MDKLLTIYFISLAISFVLVRVAYINYLKSIGLEYNPNKTRSFVGFEIKKFYHIPNVIDNYIATKNLKLKQRRFLVWIKNWEIFNLILLAFLPVIIAVSIVY